MWLLCFILMDPDMPAEVPPDPPLCEVLRFPPHDVVDAQLCLNRAYRDHLQSRLILELHHEDALLQALGDTDRLGDTWRALQAAQDESTAENERRASLAILRFRLGWEAWYGARMPPAVPLWHFHELAPSTSDSKPSGHRRGG